MKPLDQIYLIQDETVIVYLDISSLDEFEGTMRRALFYGTLYSFLARWESYVGYVTNFLAKEAYSDIYYHSVTNTVQTSCHHRPSN